MAEINEALAKAAEESTKGLAAGNPIIATKATRKNTGSVIRMDTFATLLEALNEISEDHFWAGFKIALGWRLRENPQTGMKLSMRMVGGMFDPDLTLESVNQFKRWSDRMVIERKITQRNIAISICAEGKTYTEAGWPYQVSDRAAKKLAIEGVEEFVKINEKPKVENKPIPKIKPDRSDFKVSKVIVFE